MNVLLVEVEGFPDRLVLLLLFREQLDVEFEFLRFGPIGDCSKFIPLPTRLLAPGRCWRIEELSPDDCDCRWG